MKALALSSDLLSSSSTLIELWFGVIIGIRLILVETVVAEIQKIKVVVIEYKSQKNCFVGFC